MSQVASTGSMFAGCDAAKRAQVRFAAPLSTPVLNSLTREFTCLRVVEHTNYDR
jgi:hypothetical protein